MGLKRIQKPQEALTITAEAPEHPTRLKRSHRFQRILRAGVHNEKRNHGAQIIKQRSQGPQWDVRKDKAETMNALPGFASIFYRYLIDERFFFPCPFCLNSVRYHQS